MEYLNEKEFADLGFDKVENFQALYQRAKIAIDLYTNGFYDRYVKFEKDYEFRKKAIKLAMAFQIAYLDSSGVMSADDKKALTSISIGRTSLSYQTNDKTNGYQNFNLSLDAMNLLNDAGFGMVVSIDYDR